MSNQVTEAFYSGVEVMVRLANSSIIDVSDDVESVTVSRRKSAISTASVTLNNAGSYSQGKYSAGKWKLHPGDAVHISFLKNDRTIEAFTGKISKCPAFGFYNISYSFDCEDAIGDLHYIYWDPYSTKAIEKYWNGTMSVLSNDSKSSNDAESGSQLVQFLQDVCGFPSSMIKIAKFPNQNKFVDDIIGSITDGKAQSDDMALSIFQQLFGPTNMSDASSSKNGSAAAGDVDSYQGVIKKMLNLDAKSNMNDVGKEVGFVNANSNTTYDWTHMDGEGHTGKYGLTQEQMKKWAKIDKAAKDCSASAQDKAMKAICLDISKGTGSEDAACIIFYYFTGLNIKDKKGKADLKLPSNAYLKIGNTTYKTLDKWKAFIDKQIGKTSSSSSSGSSSSHTSNSATGSTAMDRKLDAFLKKHADGTPSLDVDGAFGHQCWDLYLSYGKEVLGFSMGSPEMMQDAGGNGAFYNAMPKGSSGNVLKKIPPSETCQKGDIVLWRSSPGDGGYGHVAIVLSDKGSGVDCLSQGGSIPTVFRMTMPKNSGGYSLAGYLRPTGVTGSSDDSGSSDGSSSDSATATAEDLAYKLFKYVTYVGQTPSYESEALTGPLALYNDKPALEFVQSLCKGSMREFMTLPDGSFAAFVPDYFGKLHASGILNNEISIPQYEIVDYSADFNKSMYTSHVYLLTREHMDTQYGVTIGTFDEVQRLLQSNGTISLEKQGDSLLKLVDISITGCKTASQLLQRFGVSVYDTTDNYIIDSTMTAVKALLIFMERWAACFSNTLKITFRPEILPGIRLRLEGAGVTVFVESVTHSWSATNGGATNVQISSPVETNTGKVGL
jgi:hypothetical protein